MLEVIAGCMYSGKSEELIRRLRRCNIAKQPVVAFKPAIDNRYHSGDIATHPTSSGEGPSTFFAIPVSSVEQIEESIASFEVYLGEYGVIGIDEVQFMDRKIVGLLESYANKGHRVVVAGLDLDSEGNVFGPMADLLAMADSVTKLSAVCVAPSGDGLCGKPATRSYRYTSVSTGNQIQVGSSGVYEARCRECWVKGQKK